MANTLPEDTITFKASSAKALRILLISIAFVAIGIWMPGEMPLLVRLGVWFFALGIPVSLIMLLMPNSAHLKLDPEGFEIRTFFRAHKTLWQDVAQFSMGSIHGATMIGIRYSGSYDKQKAARAFASSLAGMEGAIPNSYNARPEEILIALQAWHAKFA